MTKETNRLPFIDIAKAFAIIFIVIGHSVAYSEHCNNIFKFLYSFHVALFFFLSGYTFTTSKKFKEFIKTKFSRIMIPYYFWSLAFLIPYVILGKSVSANLDKAANFDIKSTILNIFYASGKGLIQNRPLWFLPALFTTLCVYYLLIKFANKSKTHSIILLVISLIVAVVCNKFLTLLLPMSINHVIIIGPIFHIGYLFNKFNLKEYVFKHFYYIIPMILVGTICALENSLISYRVLTLGNIFLAYLSTLLLSISSVYIAFKIKENKLLEYIGQNTMGILIFHKLLIVLFQSKLGVISNLLKNSNIFIELILCLLISALTIIFSILATKIVKLILPILVGENGSSLLKKIKRAKEKRIKDTVC